MNGPTGSGTSADMHGGTPGGVPGSTYGDSSAGMNGSTYGDSSARMNGSTHGGTPAGTHGGTPAGTHGGTAPGTHGGTPVGMRGGAYGGAPGAMPGSASAATPGGSPAGMRGGASGATPGSLPPATHGGTPAGMRGGAYGGAPAATPGSTPPTTYGSAPVPTYGSTPTPTHGNTTTEALLRDIREQLSDGGLRGCLLVRDLHTGDELGIDADTQLPSASLVKVPLALATVERIRRGELDGSTMLEVQPGRVTTPGPTGLSRFRHPARIAIDDLLYLSVCLSDGMAADALFELTPPAEVSAILHELGIRGITVRHTVDELSDTPVERFDADQIHLAHALAIDAGTSGRGHRVPQLDTTRANTGSARTYADLLQALWTPSKIHPDVAARLRDLMAHNVLRHRLTPDFSSDASTWSSKTGTLLNLRHEIGVVEHSDGQSFAIAVLTESLVPAGAQPGADALMAQAARSLRDHLRQL